MDGINVACTHHEHGDLRGRPQCHPECDVELVLEREDDGAGVLGGVADDGEKDDADEADGEAPRLGGGLDGAHHVLWQHGDDDGHEDEPQERAPEAQHRHLLFLGFVAPGAAALDLLRLEELAVRLELEEEVGHVGEEHDEAGCPGELQHRRVGRHRVLPGAHRVPQQQRQRLAQRAQDQQARADVRLFLHTHRIQIVEKMMLDLLQFLRNVCIAALWYDVTVVTLS